MYLCIRVIDFVSFFDCSNGFWKFPTVWYFLFFILLLGPSWAWSYDSWIYNYLYNRCLSPLMLWVQISIRVKCTTLCDKVCRWLPTGRWFSLGSPVSSTNKTDCHDITEIVLKVALNTIKLTNKQTNI
jgi:hypothetical protein